jgi:hypothetical protein
VYYGKLTGTWGTISTVSTDQHNEEQIPRAKHIVKRAKKTKITGEDIQEEQKWENKKKNKVRI